MAGSLRAVWSGRTSRWTRGRLVWISRSERGRKRPEPGDLLAGAESGLSSVTHGQLLQHL